jgi:hypothetical protein
MNVHRLVTWADRLLKLSPPGGAAKGSTLAKLRAAFDKLPTCKAFIKNFRDDVVPLLECQKILKTHGLSRITFAQCQPIIETIASTAVRIDFTAYLQAQLATATDLELDKVGLPISSDQIESLFGLAKQHGLGQTKDASRIAIHLPALCGTLSREEAARVLEISVAERREIIGCVPSLTKQRREVLNKKQELESLGREHVAPHIELIPRAKKRVNNTKKYEISNCYTEDHGPHSQPLPCREMAFS